MPCWHKAKCLAGALWKGYISILPAQLPAVAEGSAVAALCGNPSETL